MPDYLFLMLLFLVLLVFCTLCEAADIGSPNMVTKLFKPGIIDVLQPKGDGEKSTDVKNFSSSFLVGTGDVVVGLAQAREADGTYGILTKYIGTEGENWGDKAFEEDCKNWKAQWALKGGNASHIPFASAAKNNGVYILSASKVQSAPPSSERTTNATAWGFQLTAGKITEGADATGKRIEWDTQNVPDCFVADIQQGLQDVSPFDESAFSMEDGTLVFVFEAWSLIEKKYFYVIAYSKYPDHYFNFNFVNTTANCSFGFFSWGEQLFMIPKKCFGDNSSDHKVQVSNDMGETWGEATGPLAWNLNWLGNEGSSFTGITIEGKRVVLFVKAIWEEYRPKAFFTHHLLAVDQYQAQIPGPIATSYESFPDGSIFYANKELFLSVAIGDSITVLIRLRSHQWEIKRMLDV